MPLLGLHYGCLLSACSPIQSEQRTSHAESAAHKTDEERGGDPLQDQQYEGTHEGRLGAVGRTSQVQLVIRPATV